MEYMSVREAAELWRISVRRVQVLCENNRIEGVTHIGNVYAIPKNAKKPRDARIKSDRHINNRKDYTSMEGKMESDSVSKIATPADAISNLDVKTTNLYNHLEPESIREKESEYAPQTSDLDKYKLRTSQLTLDNKILTDSMEHQEVESKIDPRNKLNDLNGSEWLPETKSFFFQKGLGASHSHAQIERLHPAPYSFQDVSRLILFFTKKGQTVLDPFGGVGSTAKACTLNARICTSIELSEKWHSLAITRLNTEIEEGEAQKHHFIHGDCRVELKAFESNTFDFMVTSPPYWAILNKKADHKVKNGRVKQQLDTNYSEDMDDLGNIERYSDFLDILVHDVFLECSRVIKPKKYMCIIVSDFRNKSEFISFHSDLIQRMKTLKIDEEYMLTLQGVKILAQNHKTLIPYGYPFAYVENIHHQYILIFRKIETKKHEAYDEI